MSLPIHNGSYLNASNVGVLTEHYESFEFKNQACTDSVATVTLTATARKIVLYNEGSSSVELLNSNGDSFGDGIEIPATDYKELEFDSDTIYLICDTSNTADMRIIAFM